jgi:hypothetical protein
MSNKTVEDWTCEIERGLEYRLKYGLESRWLENEASFYNVRKGDVDNSGPNIIASTGDALLSNLGVPYPRINVKARKAQFLNSSRVVESVDNNLIYDMGMPTQVDESMLACYLWGRGFLKIGYDSSYGYDTKLDYNGPKKPIGMSITQYNKAGDRIEFGPNVQPGMPWVESVLPHDIVVPWGTKSLQSAEWIAHRIVRHIDDVKADLKYKNTARLEPVMSMKDFVDSYQKVRKDYRLGQQNSIHSRSEGEDNCEYCELWEIHDRRTKKVLVVATGYDKFLRNVDDLLQDDYGLPFVSFSFVPTCRNFWVTSLAEYLRQQQAELTDIAIQGTKQRRLSTLKMVYRDGAIDDDQLARALSSSVGAAFKVNQSAGPISESIGWFNGSNANYMLYQEAQQTRENARETVGFGRNQLGTFEPGGRRTAYEVSQVANANSVRMNRLQNVLRKVYEETFCKVNNIIFRFWKAPKLAEVLDAQGIPQWMEFVGEQIKGEYKINISFDNDNPETLQYRRQQAMQFYMQLSQDPTVDQVALRQMLANAFNDPEFSAIFKPGVLQGQFVMNAASGVPTPSGGQQALPPGQSGQAMTQAMMPPEMAQQGLDQGQGGY